MKINKLNPRHWYFLFLQAAYTFTAIVLRPLLRKPTTPVVVLYGHQFAGHLAAIYDQWARAEASHLHLYYLSLNRDPVLVNASTEVNVLRCTRFRDMLLVARASTIITDHGLHMMAPLVRYTDIKFIDVGHGIPFKGYDEQDFRLQRHYTEMWTSSRGLSDLYAARCGCKHVVNSVGSPRTDKLINSVEQHDEFRRFLSIPEQNPIILYAPTWQQDSQGRTLIPFEQPEDDFLRRLDDFCAECDCYLVFRIHQNASFTARPLDHIIFCPQARYPDTESILSETDLLISDWSSIVFDFLVLNRPTIFLDVPIPFAKGCTLGPEYRFGRIVQNMDELLNALAVYVRSPTSYLSDYGSKHQSVKDFVYDDYADGRSSERCLQRLEYLLTTI